MNRLKLTDRYFAGWRVAQFRDISLLSYLLIGLGIQPLIVWFMLGTTVPGAAMWQPSLLVGHLAIFIWRQRWGEEKNNNEEEMNWLSRGSLILLDERLPYFALGIGVI